MQVFLIIVHSYWLLPHLFSTIFLKFYYFMHQYCLNQQNLLLKLIEEKNSEFQGHQKDLHEYHDVPLKFQGYFS